MTDPDWWRQAVVYQIYPRSFADSSGDGLGDLAGVTSRVGYLKNLGIDAVWLSPFYPSALADGGYDVDDYRDVDPRLGTLEDFDEMRGALHDAGIKVIVDIVPNHTSDRHEWFRAALDAGTGSPERERYIFRKGNGLDRSEPPSDWQSVFGGPAWQRVADGEWYLHLFAPEQPDLNWDHPDVHEDFKTTIRFWADRGVDGFRVDVAHGLVKDLTEPHRPAAELEDEEALMLEGSHPLWDRDDVHDIYAEWRTVFDEFDPPRIGVAEAWVPTPRRSRYASPEGLGQAFNFDLLEADWSAETFRAVIAENLALAAESGTSSTWVLSNHDVVRHASRYGLPDGSRAAGERWLLGDGVEPELDRERGLQRGRAATMLVLALPGSAYIYQGEELGLHEVADLPPEVLQDPTWERSEHAVKGRDGCRVPLPWASGGPAYGFSPHEAHLPQPQWYAECSVEAQDSDPGSTLNLYRSALGLRRRLRTAEELTWGAADAPSVIHLVRPGGWHSVTNFGHAPVAIPPGDVLLASDSSVGEQMPGETTVWLRVQGNGSATKD